jgi:hypothetical protein
VNWDQLKAIIWLRWRLTKNQFQRGGNLNAALSVVMIIFLILGSIGVSVGSVIGGFFAGLKAPAEVLLLIWDCVIFIFLIFWSVGITTEIQRAESIDLTKLLHLPITLNQVFTLNYIASHASHFVLFVLVGFGGLSVGMIFGGGLRLVPVFLLAFGFFFAVSAWTYCLRGWLTALMTNKRRRRSIVVWTTLIIVLLGQLPNAFIQLSNRNRHKNPKPAAQVQHVQNQQQKNFNEIIPVEAMQAHLFIPPGWVGYGAMLCKQGNPWPALGWTAVLWATGALGLMKSYRMTVRYYRGTNVSKAPRAPAKQMESTPSSPSTHSAKPMLIERRFKFLPDDLAAMALASFLTLIRSPEVKMAAIFPLIMLVLVWFADFDTALKKIPEAAMLFPMTGAIAATCFAFMQTAGNIFGLDRNAFRGMVLLPTPRHYILIAKNLAILPFQLATIALLLGSILCKTPFSVEMLLTALVQIPTGFIVMALFSNMYSILVPFRMALGSLKAQKPPASVVLSSLLGTLLLPFVFLPLALPALIYLLFHSQGWMPWLPIGLLTAILVLGAAIALYIGVIPAQGRLLQRRELHILKQVTEEVE